MSPRVIGATIRGDMAHEARTSDAWPGAVAPAEVASWENGDFLPAGERVTRRRRILEQQAAQRIVGAVGAGLELNNSPPETDPDSREYLPGQGNT